MDPSQILQSLLFAFFSGLTSLVATVTGPTYDNLLVPALAPAALYPALGPTGGGGFLGEAATFSGYLLVNLVDPAIALVAVGAALLYLGRALLGRWAVKFEALLPRLVLSVILANFTLPIAGALFDLAGAAYPVFAQFDGGAWQHWVSLAGVGELNFAWDNGALAFVVAFALFSLVLLLAAVVAVRDALLAVLLVLLPVFTLLAPIPALAPLARRAWTMFGQLAFLPCILVIPLELAVGSSNVLLLLGYLTVALSTPSLVSLASAQLSGLGFPSAGGALTGGIQRGLSVASLSVGNLFRPLAGVSGASRASQWAGRLGRSSQAASRAPFPATVPLFGADLAGRSVAHLFRHLGAPAVQPLARASNIPAVARPRESRP